MRREKMKAMLRTKACKRWKRNIREPDGFQINAFCTGFNMGWKCLKGFLRKRVQRAEQTKKEFESLALLFTNPEAAIRKVIKDNKKVFDKLA